MEISRCYLSLIDAAALQKLHRQGLQGGIGSTFVICHHQDVEYYVCLHFRSDGPVLMFDGRSFYPMELPRDPQPERMSLTGLQTKDSPAVYRRWGPIMISVGLRSGLVLEGSDPYATSRLKRAHLLAALRDVVFYDSCCHTAIKANLVDDVTIHLPTVTERMSAVVLGVQSSLETALMDRLRDSAPARVIEAAWNARTLGAITSRENIRGIT